MGAYQKVDFFDAINTNKRNTIILLIGVFLLFYIIVSIFSYMFDLGTFGLILGLFILFFYAAFSFFAGDKMILGMSGAKKAEKKQYPFLFHVVEGLSMASGIPMPEVYVVEDPSPNAFAIGRDPKHASVAVTTGLLKIMNREELEGVLAHEISHIANYDIRHMLIAVVFAGAIALVAHIAIRTFSFGGGRKRGGHPALIILGLLLMILAPVFAELIRLAISRQREYLADANGARLTRYPPGLAGALEKISKFKEPVMNASDATAPMYFSNPMPNKFAFMFSTHPPVEERIKRLRGM